MYAKEGWPLVFGENRVARMNGAYTVSVDHDKNMYVATRK